MKITHKGWNLQDDGSYVSGSTGNIMTPHKYKNRKDIYKDQKTGLLYERLSSGWFNRIPQKMTELQELEEFRKSSGLVAMTSRSRGRIPPPSDQVLVEESEK